jgi:DNA-directed RNA polymerase subunit F
MPKRIVGRKEITISEAKALMDKIETPNQFQVRTKEYIDKFSKVDPAKVPELLEELLKLKIERDDAIQVINSMPSTIEELRVFFSSGRKRLVPTTQLEEMLKILDKYRLHV